MRVPVMITALLLVAPLMTMPEMSNTGQANSITLVMNIAKPGCPRQCGNVTVPYPFGIGIGSGCSINPHFDVNCSSSSDPPKLLMKGLGEIEIFQMDDSRMRIFNFVSWRCYSTNDSESTRGDQWMNLGYGRGPYTISEENTFYVIGCGDYALLSARNKVRNALTGCLAYCSGPEDVPNGECSGNGCCQTALLKDIYYYRTEYITFPTSAYINATRAISPCTYSFVGEKDAFKFKGASDLNDPSFNERIKASVPRVLEWAIGHTSCAEAHIRKDYACQTNSKCVDSKRISGGYRCSCKHGYHGNPYLPPGCQDINECKDRIKYPCYGVCVNTPGSFNCNCPHGQIGDGRIKNGCLPANKNKNFPETLSAIGIVMAFGVLIFGLWLHKVMQMRKRKEDKERFFKTTDEERFFETNDGLLLQEHIGETNQPIQ